MQWGVDHQTGGYFPETFLLQNGVQSYDEATNTFNFAQPDATAGLQNIADLMHVHHVAPVASNLKDLGMSNTWWGVALPQAAFALPMTIVILRPFLQAIPAELEEAAAIDGASRLSIFTRIMVPLSGAGLVTVGVLAFVGSWNAYLLPLLLLQGDMRTLPLGVADFSTEHSSDTAGVFAFTTLSMIPAMVFFLTMQRRIVGGLQGAVKG